MNKADCFNLGYVAKLHGFKGEVSLFFDVTNPGDYQSLDAVYIDINDNLTPFFVESIKLKQKGFAQVKFEGVDSENDAKVIHRKDLYLPLSILPPLSGTRFYDHEVIGWEVIDTNFGSVGNLLEVIDNNVNPLLQIDKEGTEVLIPFIDNLVQKVDRDKKQLTVTAPEGLIEMYLND